MLVLTTRWAVHWFVSWETDVLPPSSPHPLEQPASLHLLLLCVNVLLSVRFPFCLQQRRLNSTIANTAVAGETGDSSSSADKSKMELAAVSVHLPGCCVLLRSPWSSVCEWIHAYQHVPVNTSQKQLLLAHKNARVSFIHFHLTTNYWLMTE